MLRHRGPPLVFIVLLACAAGCSPGASPDGASRSDNEGPRPGPKQVTLGMSSRDPNVLRSSLSGAGSIPGIDALEDLIHAGATRRDSTDKLRPLLADALPSIENGHWVLSPDGPMETTWTIKPGASWQDGTPFTTQDLLFTLAVSRDRDMIEFNAHVGYAFIDNARALDDQTVSVTWKSPYIEADALFSSQFGMPIPKHLLEPLFQESKRSLVDSPYWTRQFVGTGPFQLRDWVQGSYITLAAFDLYILGRPKLDEIVVKFIPDTNSMVANMLAADVDLNLGRGLSLDQALQLRDQWPGAQMQISLIGLMMAYPQFIDPRPGVLLDVRLRKALVHAIDRPEMVDTLQSGLSTVAHAYFDTSQPQYQRLDPLVVKYPFDPRRAAQLIESTGYSRGPDGIFHDASGERLAPQIRVSSPQAIATKTQLSIADYWQRLGVAAETADLRTQQMSAEVRATFAAFDLYQAPEKEKGLRRAHSSQTPLPENNFTMIGNVARYMNGELDSLLDRYFSTVPMGERMQVLGQVLNHTSDQVTFIPIFWGTQPTVASSRLTGVGARPSQEATEAWNAPEWDVH